MLGFVVRVAAEQYLSQTGVDSFSSLGAHLTFIRRNASRGHFHVMIYSSSRINFTASNIVSAAVTELFYIINSISTP